MTKNSKAVLVDNCPELKIGIHELEEVNPEKLDINTLYFFDKKIGNTPNFFDTQVFFKKSENGKAFFTTDERTEIKDGKFVGEFVTRELEVPLDGSVKIFSYPIPPVTEGKSRKNRKTTRMNRKATRKNRTTTRKNRNYRRLL